MMKIKLLVLFIFLISNPCFAERIKVTGTIKEGDPIVGAINGIVKADGAGNFSAVTDNSANWDTAYGWGDHALVGYLTAETDPLSLHLNQTTPQHVTGGKPIFDEGLQVGEVGSGTSTATPKVLALGDTFGNDNGLYYKIKLYEDVSGYILGFGVSLNRMDYMVPFDSHHVFYLGATQMVNIGMNGLTFGEFSTEPRVVYVGDSLTYGLYGTHPYTYYITLPTYNGITLVGYNKGMSGQTIYDLLRYGGTDTTTIPGIDAYHSILAGRNILVVWAGAADIILYSMTPAQAFSYLQQYCQDRQRAGWKVIVCTMISAVDNDANKNTYNSYIRTFWRTFADGLADIASNTNLGADGAYANTTYFNADGIHLSDTGYAAVAPIVQAAIVRVNSETRNLIRTIAFAIRSFGEAIPQGAGAGTEKTISFNGTITGAEIYSSTSGNITVDVLKSTTASPNAENFSSITASDPLTLNSAVRNTSALTGWNTTLPSGASIKFNVTSTGNPSGLVRGYLNVTEDNVY